MAETLTTTNATTALPSALGILFIGDVVADAGMKALAAYLPAIKERYTPDSIIINGENVVGGKGLTEVEAKQLFNWGADVITTGNHIWENWKSRPLLASNPRVLRPHNYPMENPGTGVAVTMLGNGVRLGVVQLQGRTYMQTIDCPFHAIDAILPELQNDADVIIFDFHAEATGEKVSMGWYVDGRVSAMLGTHTHVQTADARILPGGTAYITDVGMTGAFDSALGMRTDVAIRRFMLQTAFKYEPATGDPRVSGAFVRVEVENGHALSVESFIYPPLSPFVP
jgi:metallophosphoesterase (TIGR00282 family)